jgi:peptide/nickel transport system substrate-binding protein
MTASARPLRWSVALLSALALFAGACSGGSTTEEATESDGTVAPVDDGTETSGSDGLDGIDELVIAASSLANLHLDPVAPIEFGVYKVNLALMYDWIVGANPDGTLNEETGLVESWERVEDERKWVFTLREGVTYHNGDPVVAEDVVFQIERVLNPESETGSRGIFESVVESISAVDERTFEVVTVGTDITTPYLLSNHGLLEGLLVPSEYFQSLGDDLAGQKQAFLQAPVGSGPYKFVESVSGSHILLERNDNYWGGTPRFERIRVVEVPDQSTRIGALENGEAHIIEISRRDAEGAVESGFNVHRKPGGATMGLVMHEQWVPENPLSDARVRLAVHHAIDKESLLSTLFAGQGRLVDTWRIGSYGLGYEYNDPPAHDPERTRELLAEAGAEDLSVTLLGFERQGLPEAREMMEAITGMLQDAGIDATLEWTEQSVVFDTWFAYPDHPNESPMLERWGPSISLNNTGNQTFWQQNAKFVYLPEGLARVTFSDELSEFIANADAAVTDVEYAANTRAAQQHLRDNAIELAMFELDTLYASVPEITEADWPMDIYQFSWNVETLAVER